MVLSVVMATTPFGVSCDVGQACAWYGMWAAVRPPGCPPEPSDESEENGRREAGCRDQRDPSREPAAGQRHDELDGSSRREERRPRGRASGGPQSHGGGSRRDTERDAYCVDVPAVQGEPRDATERW